MVLHLLIVPPVHRSRPKIRPRFSSSQIFTVSPRLLSDKPVLERDHVVGLLPDLDVSGVQRGIALHPLLVGLPCRPVVHDVTSVQTSQAALLHSFTAGHHCLRGRCGSPSRYSVSIAPTPIRS